MARTPHPQEQRRRVLPGRSRSPTTDQKDFLERAQQGSTGRPEHIPHQLFRLGVLWVELVRSQAVLEGAEVEDPVPHPGDGHHEEEIPEDHLGDPP